jgi:hypothetical protein
LGQDYALQAARLSGCFAFSKQTFAGTSGNDADAPIADGATGRRAKPTHC